MHYSEIDTPALLIDRERVWENIAGMQDFADRNGVALRPHTKTHKMSALAGWQVEAGAQGITVAKVGEAEVMAQAGLDDIFIANQVVGSKKLERIRQLSGTIDISFGIDSIHHVEEADAVFKGSGRKAQVVVEIEVGEKRSGIIEADDFKKLLETIGRSDNVHFRGVFSHDGHTYKAEDAEACRTLYEESAHRTLGFAQLAREMDMPPEVISIGSTPPFMLGFDIPDGITEIRPGTYILMDAGQSNVIGTYAHCAASVLTSVISKPTQARVITDVGAKGLTMQTRIAGITRTEGLGLLREYEGVHIDSVFDEHAIIYDEAFNRNVAVGERVRIIPNHICPVSNLYDTAWLVSGDEVLEEIRVDARGRLQ